MLYVFQSLQNRYFFYYESFFIFVFLFVCGHYIFLLLYILRTSVWVSWGIILAKFTFYYDLVWLKMSLSKGILVCVFILEQYSHLWSYLCEGKCHNLNSVLVSVFISSQWGQARFYNSMPFISELCCNSDCWWSLKVYKL